MQIRRFCRAYPILHPRSKASLSAQSPEKMGGQKRYAAETDHAITLSYLLPGFEVEFLAGACTKYRFQLAVDNQQLGNFQVEEPFSVLLLKLIAVISLVGMEECRS